MSHRRVEADVAKAGAAARVSTSSDRVCIISGSSRSLFTLRAEVAELADAQASGACGRKVVEVQILSSALPFSSMI